MAIFDDALNRFIDQAKLESLLALPRNYLGERIDAIVPNLNMTNEGPVLTKLFLFTSRFICEVRIGDDGNSNFDVMDKSMIKNIRVSREKVEVSVGEEITVYKTAIVTAVHEESMASNFSFVGDDRDEWLAEVLKLIPASSCLQHS